MKISKKIRKKLKKKYKKFTNKLVKFLKFKWALSLFSLQAIARYSSIAFSLSIIGFFGIIYFAKDLPDISEISKKHTTPNIIILDYKGKEIANYGDVYGEYLSYKNISPNLIKAVIATEDRRFFQHLGVDPLGIIRAIIVDIKKGRLIQGGSTLTQQLAKNIFLTPKRNLKRKIQELILAFWLEASFSKQEIIELYLNRVYFGAGNYGIDAAANKYFNKSARKLNLAEAALIAGLLKAPSRYSPTSSEKQARNRAKQVLLNMVNAGYLKSSEVDSAIKSLKFVQYKNGKKFSNNRYFTDYIMDILPEYLGHNNNDDIIIKTTLHQNLQKSADKAMKYFITEKIEKERKIGEAALVSIANDGAIVAMMGGRDYQKSQFNRITQAHRQSGSAFKMFVYLAALEWGFSPDIYMEDKPIKIKKWQPKNYSNKYRGMVTLLDSLTHSINSVAVQLSETIGRENVIAAAHKLGIKSDLPNIPSIALGSVDVTPLEMTTAYAHLPSNGFAVIPYSISIIVRKKDNKILYQHYRPVDYRVISYENVQMMNAMLVNVILSGTGRAAKFGREAAGKTGTTSNYRDAWFIGYTPQYTTSVWVGNDDSSPMNRVTGGSVPARIWRKFMQSAHKGLEYKILPTNYINKDSLPWLRDNFLPKETLNNSFWDKLFGD